MNSNTMLSASSLMYQARRLFLPVAREHTKQKKLTTNEFSSDCWTAISQRAVKRIELAINHGFVDHQSKKPQVEIPSLSSRLPDSNDNLRKYQIDHIAGRRVTVKKYAISAWKTLRTHSVPVRSHGRSTVRRAMKMHYKSIRRRECEEHELHR